jgi:hypothetical protein
VESKEFGAFAALEAGNQFDAALGVDVVFTLGRGLALLSLVLVNP